jgi:hypothetical protein
VERACPYARDCSPDAARCGEGQATREPDGYELRGTKAIGATAWTAEAGPTSRRQRSNEEGQREGCEHGRRHLVLIEERAQTEKRPPRGAGAAGEQSRDGRARRRHGSLGLLEPCAVSPIPTATTHRISAQPTPRLPAHRHHQDHNSQPAPTLTATTASSTSPSHHLGSNTPHPTNPNSPNATPSSTTTLTALPTPAAAPPATPSCHAWALPSRYVCRSRKGVRRAAADPLPRKPRREAKETRQAGRRPVAPMRKPIERNRWSETHRGKRVVAPIPIVRSGPVSQKVPPWPHQLHLPRCYPASALGRLAWRNLGAGRSSLCAEPMSA